jgi:hypothetical protein
MIERRAKAPVTVRRTLCAGFAALLSSGQMSFAQTPIDIYAYFQKASGLGSDGLARKTKIVDVRQAPRWRSSPLGFDQSRLTRRLGWICWAPSC